MDRNGIIATILIIFIFLSILAFVGGSIWLEVARYTNKEITEITIKDKYVDVNNENGVFLIVSMDNYTYKVSDLLFKGKFNSTDIYNNLEIGKTYEIETTGYRIPFLSEYKNINKYTLKEGQDEH